MHNQLTKDLANTSDSCQFFFQDFEKLQIKFGSTLPKDSVEFYIYDHNL